MRQMALVDDVHAVPLATRVQRLREASRIVDAVDPQVTARPRRGVDDPRPTAAIVQDEQAALVRLRGGDVLPGHEEAADGAPGAWVEVLQDPVRIDHG